MNKATVGISDLNVAKNPDALITYALGSCVGICLYDPTTKIAGLSHILLPSSKDVSVAGNPQKFADTGITELVRRMEITGAKRSRLRAKIAGGAQMFGGPGLSAIGNIGARNVSAVKTVLAELHIPIVAEDTGKDYGRTVTIFAEDGMVLVKSATKGEWKL